MKILIAGGSGLIGQALVPALRASGHEVRRLIRAGNSSLDAVRWNPATRTIDPAALAGVDAVINLAGENIAAGRWSAARRERILRSRVDATSTVVAAIMAADKKPAVLLSASATGFYGDRGDEKLTEASAIGHGFLPEVCLAWETHAEGATRAGVRVGLMRFGVVLAEEGGALGKMLPLFRLGLGGPLGNGRQWMSWISRTDVVRAIEHALTEPRCVGPLNFTAPEPVTNAEFTKTLARVLRRPAVLPAPAWALRMAFGRAMADGALLASTRVVPARLQETGFGFRHPELETALRAVLAEEPVSR